MAEAAAMVMDPRERNRRNIVLALVHLALAAGILALFVWLHSGSGHG